MYTAELQKTFALALQFYASGLSRKTKVSLAFE